MTDSNCRTANQKLLVNIQEVVSDINDRTTTFPTEETLQSISSQVQKIVDQLAIKSAGDDSLNSGQSTVVGAGSSVTPVSPGSCGKRELSPIRVEATLATTSDCDPFCSCQCHIKSQIQTPHWLHSVLGTLLYSSTVLPLSSSQPCNLLSCRRSGPGSTRLSYFFPSWAVARVFHMTSTWRSVNGADATWTARMPRVISDDAPLWYHLKRREMNKIKLLFGNGQASPYDVDIMGSSVLHVGHPAT